ncbi:cytochrome c oxidase subunit II [Aurantiacibacter hainanensis]|uniref:cytochrome c oxidase subunit II n=1 Tax=Aurantiacibacter hainanensis TaxID=3076114 RepID=UPI0030C6D7D5
MESIDAMNFGAIARKKLNILAIALLAALSLATVPSASFAQDDAETTLVEGAAAEGLDTLVTDAEAPAFEYYGPEMIKGQPTSSEEDIWKSMTFQDQYTADGDYALWMHDAILLPIITIISLFVLGLLLWVMFRYNKRKNTVPSKTSHNTLIEVIWTVIPVLILVVIAVPSITLLARQYQTPPEDAITIKANGYQWYWGYEYVDNGGFEVISNMMPESDALDAGLPPQLAVDNRMVVPVGVPIRLQTFGADVIHAFGIPSLWFKMDAVPGRINEKMLTIEEPGIYYGQCMELCGARHGYMPIAIEARPLDEYNAWVQAQPGGMTRAQIEAQEAAAAAPAPAEDEGAVVEGVRPPVSSQPDAPIAGEPPTEDTSPTT